MDELLNPETDEGLTVTTVRLYDFCVTRAWFNRGLSIDIVSQRLDGEKKVQDNWSRQNVRGPHVPHL